jgi:hypothetical protein
VSVNGIEWAREAAKKIVENYADSAAIDTANYQECGFIMAAAELALSNESFATQIAQRMGPPRLGREG